ncbi:Thioesterase family protein [Coniochaeta hoffmannii]|uniref:Thioesterase family protein n=1 Tax=Coniochaeta hoffmannii TaxID=91930 RepID=A0AA38S9N9_9PEZI|nr:Thioesterase family protein [Coniochaeta hoffmannii]
MASSKNKDSAPMPLAKAIEATPLDSHTYAVNLQQCFCIGTVPNGGYSATTLLQAAHLHLSPRKQPDTVTVHFEFVNPTEVGPAIIVVEEVKLGRTLSVLHVTLYQRGLLSHSPWITPGTSRKEIVAYVTNGNIASEQGVSVPTSFLPLTPPTSPVVNLSLLPAGKDPVWHRMPLPEGPFGKIRSLENMEYFVPRAGQPQPDRIDLWMRLASGGRFTNAALAYVVDAWPYIIEQYRPKNPGEKEPYGYDQAFWYPTVALNIEVKKALPPGGVEWLFIRERAKMVRNGRFDIEVVVLDAEGELVALASHVAMIVDSARNLGRAKGGGKGKEKGKL